MEEKKIWVSMKRYDLIDDFIEARDILWKDLGREPTLKEADEFYAKHTSPEDVLRITRGTRDEVKYPSKPIRMWIIFGVEGMLTLNAEFEATEKEAREFASKYNAVIYSKTG